MRAYTHSILGMSYPSLPSSSGVGSKLEILRRCVTRLIASFCILTVSSWPSPCAAYLKALQDTAIRHSTKRINRRYVRSSPSTSVHSSAALVTRSARIRGCGLSRARSSKHFSPWRQPFLSGNQAKAASLTNATTPPGQTSVPSSVLHS